MIITMKGDLLARPKGHILHGCNCQGVMGSGIALSIRNKWPEVFEVYRAEYETNGLSLGQAIPVRVSEHLVVWNLTTQEFYKNHPDAPAGTTRFASYDAIADAFESMQRQAIQDYPVIDPSINFPLIGAGLGGAEWPVINEIIDHTLFDEFDKVLWLFDK